MTAYPKFPEEQAAKPTVLELVILAFIHSSPDSRARNFATEALRALKQAKVPNAREAALLTYANTLAMTGRGGADSPACGHWIVQYVMHGDRPQYRLECAVCNHEYGIFDWDVNDDPKDFEVKEADPKNIKHEPMKPFTFVAQDEEISRETYDAIAREQRLMGSVHASTIAQVRAQVQRIAFTSSEFGFNVDLVNAAIDEVAKRPPPGSVLEVPREQLDQIVDAAKREERGRIEFAVGQLFCDLEKETRRWRGEHGVKELFSLRDRVRACFLG